MRGRGPHVTMVHTSHPEHPERSDSGVIGLEDVAGGGRVRRGTFFLFGTVISALEILLDRS